MNAEFVPLGLQSPENIRMKLQEIEGEAGLSGFALHDLLPGQPAAQPWLNVQHQYGFIAPFTPGAQRHVPIVAASNLNADETLRGQRINIHLGHLRVYRYPTPLLNFGPSQHTILFTFEARNQVESAKTEPVAFNQLYKAVSGQDVAAVGLPIFIGLTVGAHGIGFSCRTVNVANSSDEALVGMLNSDTVSTGLSLLTTAQPALGPLATLARGICVSLAAHHRNVPVQEVKLGLDFENGAIGVRLAIGSYVVAQTARPDDIVWNDWVYDTELGTIVASPAKTTAGARPEVLPYNAIVFRISRYHE